MSKSKVKQYVVTILVERMATTKRGVKFVDDSQKVKLPHEGDRGGIQWRNYIDKVSSMGWDRLSVDSVSEMQNDGSYEVLDEVPTIISGEFKEATSEKRHLSKEQAEIAELKEKAKIQEEQIAQLLELAKGSETLVAKTDSDDKKELDDIKVEYENVTGLKAHPMSTVNSLRKKIDEHKD